MQEQKLGVLKQALEWFQKRYLQEPVTTQIEKSQYNLTTEAAYFIASDGRSWQRFNIKLILENKSTDLYESIAYALQIKDPNNQQGDVFKELVSGLKKQFEEGLNSHLLKNFYCEHQDEFYETYRNLVENPSQKQFYGGDSSIENQKKCISTYLDNLSGPDRDKFIELSKKNLQLISLFFSEKGKVEIPLYQLSVGNPPRFWYKKAYEGYQKQDFGIVFRVDGSHAVLHRIEF